MAISGYAGFHPGASFWLSCCYFYIFGCYVWFCYFIGEEIDLGEMKEPKYNQELARPWVALLPSCASSQSPLEAITGHIETRKRTVIFDKDKCHDS